MQRTQGRTRWLLGLGLAVLPPPAHAAEVEYLSRTPRLHSVGAQVSGGLGVGAWEKATPAAQASARVLFWREPYVGVGFEGRTAALSILDDGTDELTLHYTALSVALALRAPKDLFLLLNVGWWLGDDTGSMFGARLAWLPSLGPVKFGPSLDCDLLLGVLSRKEVPAFYLSLVLSVAFPK